MGARIRLMAMGAASTGASWVASCTVPNDGKFYALIGFGGNSSVLQNHVASGVNVGGHGFFYGDAVRADLLARSDTPGGPALFPGPGVRDAKGRVLRQGVGCFPCKGTDKVEVSGSRIVGANNPSADSTSADLFAVFIVSDIPLDASRVGRPVLQGVQHSWTGAVSSSANISFNVAAGDPVRVAFQRYRAAKLDTSTPGVVALGTYHVGLTVPGQSIPYGGRVPVAALASATAESSGLGKLECYTATGEELFFDVLAANDGSAASKTVYHFLAGFMY